MFRVMVEDLELPRRLATLTVIRALRRAQVVKPVTSRHHVPTDPADSEILRTALQAGADYLVTSDRHLLALHPYESVTVITVAAYRCVLEDHGLLK